MTKKRVELKPGKKDALFKAYRSLGHREVSMTKRYRHLTGSQISALVDRVLGDPR